MLAREHLLPKHVEIAVVGGIRHGGLRVPKNPLIEKCLPGDGTGDAGNGQLNLQGQGVRSAGALFLYKQPIPMDVPIYTG
jgi:hypothetical protein